MMTSGLINPEMNKLDKLKLEEKPSVVIITEP